MSTKQRVKNLRFSEASREGCLREDGLNLDLRYILRPMESFYLLENVTPIEPSDKLCEDLAYIAVHVTVNNEQSRRDIIAAVLKDVLSRFDADRIHLFQNEPQRWKSKTVQYTGVLDYVIGSTAGSSRMFLIEAKDSWSDQSVYQVVMQLGCLQKQRSDKTPVFALLTNGLFYRFFAIDAEMTVYASRHLLFDCMRNSHFKDDPALKIILRWLFWLISCIMGISPSYNIESTETTRTSLLQTIKGQLGPRL